MGNAAERITNAVLRLIKRDRPLHWGDAVVSFRESTHELLSARWAHVSLARVAVAVRRSSKSHWLRSSRYYEDHQFRHGAFRLRREPTRTFSISPGGLGTVDVSSRRSW